MRGLSSVSIRSIRIKGDRMDTINTIRSISREFSASYQTERGRPRDSAYVSKLSSNRPLQSLRCGILYYKQSHLASKVTAQMSAPVLFLNTRTVTKIKITTVQQPRTKTQIHLLTHTFVDAFKKLLEYFSTYQ